MPRPDAMLALPDLGGSGQAQPTVRTCKLLIGLEATLLILNEQGRFRSRPPSSHTADFSPLRRWI